VEESFVKVAEQLLTGKRLVMELARLGVGHWSPDAVRQWIREEPPCPVAQAAGRGQPHRYLLADVLAWLLTRARAEKGKGHAGDAERAQLIEAALSHCAGSPAPAAEVSPAKPTAAPAAPDQEVPTFRDPRNRKAYEEARLLKLKADELEGKLIPVDDLQRSLDAQAQAFAGALEALEARLAIVLDGVDTRQRRSQLLREQFSSVRDTLIFAADLAPARGEGVAA
jgi:hypothetical protein